VSPLRVAVAADAAYLPHAATMLHSLLDHHRAEVHLLPGEDVPRRAMRRLGRMVEGRRGSFTVHPVDARRVDGLPTGSFRPIIWHRILLPELLPDADRVLYLDADTLVLEPLDELWDADLGGGHLGAVTNVFQADHAGRPAALGLPEGQPYFNSGVLLLDLARMRADGSTEALEELARTRAGELDWPDQDTLNLVLGAGHQPLHPRFNAMTSVLEFPAAADVFGAAELAEARERPAIRHFEGPSANKPWHPKCERALRECYWTHRAGTPF
jgi:lipopolysaccharide biosynthesis glycosyltransferase